MNEPVTMGAGVRELLGELASDSTARLLRVSRHQGKIEVRERAPFVRIGMPSLTKVERKLLECHREEVARLLYRYSILTSSRIPGVSRKQHYADNSPLPGEGALAVRARHSQSSPLLQRSDLGVLRSCMDARQLSPLSILAAAARFAPSPAIRIAQGSNLIHVESDYQQAEEILSSAGREGGSLLSYALEGLGAVAAERGDFKQAAREYRRSAEADPSRPMPKLAWLRFSVRCQSLEDVGEAAREVDAALSVSDPAVRWYLGMPDDGDPAQVWSRPVRIAGIPDERFGMVSRAVIHES